MATSKRWVISTSGEYSLREVERKLAEAGFAVEQVLTEIGCITGLAPDDVAKRVRALPGITDVSPDSAIDIGPPDAPVTW